MTDAERLLLLRTADALLALLTLALKAGVAPDMELVATRLRAARWAVSPETDKMRGLGG